MGKYENLQEGRYTAHISDWGVREVPKLQTLEAFIAFEFTDAGETYNITWKGLFTKKDGTPNKKTYDTLKTCGFAGKNVEALTDSGALDKTRAYDITLERENGFINVKWVNDPNASANKKADVKTLKGYDLSKINGEFAKMNMSAPSKPLKNYAPKGKGDAPDIDVDEPLGF